ncbi:transcriptional regulator, IclR family [Brevibacterium antiquum CNRZ 918]|uniref:Transcriptional regulator, IclR family n=2 Tax=Brevibacterium antiquum TaxID=234835 RepID=A0A2H1L0P0_9MICO|nr:transcriptional regulator, IclR family [Brevibacterium antiquum CNRZ 918]
MSSSSAGADTFRYSSRMLNLPLSRFGRVSNILTTLSDFEPVGLRLSDLVGLVGMPKTTVYRLLEELIDTNFVSFDKRDQSYHVGDLIDLLARRGASRFELRLRVRPFLEDLVKDLGDTVYFMNVRGGHLVCTERLVGDYPIQTMTLDIGDVRPMGVGSSGAAVASCLSDKELAELLSNQDHERRLLSIDDTSMSSIIEDARRDGFSFNPATIVPGMSGLGVPLLDSDRSPVGAVSVVAINARFSDGRLQYIVERLRALRSQAETALRYML